MGSDGRIARLTSLRFLPRLLLHMLDIKQATKAYFAMVSGTRWRFFPDHFKLRHRGKKMSFSLTENKQEH